MVVISDCGILDEVSVPRLVIFSFCVMLSESTTPVWVVVGDIDFPVTSG